MKPRKTKIDKVAAEILKLEDKDSNDDLSQEEWDRLETLRGERRKQIQDAIPRLTCC